MGDRVAVYFVVHLHRPEEIRQPSGCNQAVLPESSPLVLCQLIRLDDMPLRNDAHIPWQLSVSPCGHPSDG
jgi:hypothetical protein